MSASTHIGRIGALAAALGVGAAMLTGPAVARADQAGPDSTGPSSTDSAGTSGATDSAAPASRRPAGRVARTGGAAGQGAPAAAPDPAAATAPDAVRGGRAPAGTFDQTSELPQRSAIAGETAAATPTPAGDSVAAAQAGVAAAAQAPSAVTYPAAAVTAVSPAAAAPAAQDLKAVVAPALSATLPVAPALSASTVAPGAGVPAILAGVADRISAAVTAVVSGLAQTFSGNSPFAPPLESPADWLLLAVARRQPAAAATAAAVTGTSVGPTLFVLNGYNVVAASQKLVTSFYGPFVNFPAYPGTQSEQQFNLVDPATRKVVGSFKALQSTLAGIGVTRQLVVTDVLSGSAGIAAGQIPPVGSVISSSDNLGFGTLYTAMPTPSGNAVSFKIVSPFGDIPLSFPYDAALGLTDYVEVNKAVHLPGAGYYFAPTAPSTEEFTSVTGLQPLFTAVQGRQDYTLYDKNGVAVGGFTGLVTTTSDALGLYTKAILVTDVGGSTDVHVPPVGTVYNLINFSEKLYVLYTATPSGPGAGNSTVLVTPFGPVNVPLNFDAATPPALKPLQVPGGYKFVPTTAGPTVGVNGLPPREVITQGYQQFDVVDILGNKIGSVDADITRQWDWFGGHSEAILITKVNSGTAGPLPWNVPPVGSVFNFRQPYGINLGFSDYYSSIPTILGDVVTYGTVTPFGLVPLYLPNYLSAGLNDAKFVDPFAITT